MSILNNSVAQKATAVIAAGMLAFSLGTLPSGLAHAANNGGGSTDMFLNLQKTEDKVTDVLRDKDSNVVIGLNPLTVVKDNGDGTGSVYIDGFGGRELNNQIEDEEDTGIDVFIDDKGVPYTDDEGNIWPMDKVKVDYTGAPILHLGADGKYHIELRDDYTRNDDDIVGKNTTVTVIKTDPYTVVVDDPDVEDPENPGSYIDPGTGTVYVLDGNGNPTVLKDDGEDVQVFTDPHGKPYSDAEGNIYNKNDVETVNDEGKTPVLDENGNIIPKDRAVPIGNIGVTDEGGADSNISFTVPININFTANSLGVLTGPDPDKTYIQNNSNFGIHVSSMRFDTLDPFKVVQDAHANENIKNAIDFKIGPTGGELEGYEYLTKKAVHNQDKWSMTSSVVGTEDTVFLNTSGNVDFINNEVTSGIKIGTINWFVQTEVVEPDTPVQP